MEPPATVVGLITDLAKTYASLLHFYTRWEYKTLLRNTYRRQAGHMRVGAAGCAVSTSLTISVPLIKETYDNGFAILGNEFSTGDAGTRDKLWVQLESLKGRLEELQQAAAAGSGPLELGQLLQTSESVRISSLEALAAQYQHIAVSRPITKELPMPKPRFRQDGPFRSDSCHQRRPAPDTDDDRTTTAMTISSGPLGFQSNPPSPPPTPKLVPNDGESACMRSEICGGSASGAAEGTVTMLRPKNSVFSVFCPEAMTFQVDPGKSPPFGQKHCKCGYRWKPRFPDKKNARLLKEGFRMTARFLAKSHCDTRAYGCVLCTSSGRTEKYESVEHLCAHINASHTKWQMLHDRDMR